jgi:hypothetical protein
MKTSLLAAALAVVALHAGAYDSPPVHRNQSGSINYAPRPGVFVVVAVDDHERTVRLRARNGVAADVVVADDVYDVSKLRPGDRVQVDFLVPNDKAEPLAAAAIWPLR